MATEEHGRAWAWTTACSYAAANVMMRAAALSVDGLLGSLLRLVPVALTGWVTVATRRTGRRREADKRGAVGGTELLWLLVGGAVSYALGAILSFRALAIGGLAIAVNASQAGIVWGGILLGALLLSEPPRRGQVVGCVLIALGLVAIGASQIGTRSFALDAVLLAIAAGVCYAVQNVAVRRVQRDQAAVDAVVAVAATGGAIPLIAIVAGRAFLDPTGVLAGTSLFDVGVTLGAGFANMLAVVATAFAVRTQSVATVNAIGSAQVVLSAVAAAAFFGENLPPLLLLGSAGLILGIVVSEVDCHLLDLPAT